MTAEALDFRGRSVLAVFAHPDDESLACGGLLAWCAALGARVSVCCATAGEAGPAAGAEGGVAFGRASLGGIRLRELQDAADVLGVTDLVVLDYEDAMLPWTDAEPLEADIRSTIRRLRPDVVVTFGDDGLYGHPDHIAIHERTTAAVAALGAEAPLLYYDTMPRGRMRALVSHVTSTLARDGRDLPAPLRVLGIDEPDAFGALAPSPTLVVETGRFAVTKLAAIKCHGTQLEHDALGWLAPCDAPRLLGTEQFHRADVGADGGGFIERLAAAGPGPGAS